MTCRYLYNGKTYSAAEFMRELSDMHPEDASKYMPEVTSIPKAPIVDKTESWVLLGFKHALREAVETGKDVVTWTTGDQQADRYDLSKQVDAVEYSPAGDDKFDIRVKKGGRDVLSEDGVSLDRAEQLVGKDVAKRMADSVGEPVMYKSRFSDRQREWKSLTGLDLKVGGEGMRAFYDKMLPSAIGKYVKQWGGKVGKTRLDRIASQSEIEAAGNRTGYSWAELDKMPMEERRALVGAQLPHQWSVEITPAMREAATNGQPLFSQPYGATADGFVDDRGERGPSPPPNAAGHRERAGGAGGREPPPRGPAGAAPQPERPSSPRAPGETHADWQDRLARTQAKQDTRAIREALLRTRDLARGVMRSAWAARDRAIGAADAAIERFRQHFDLKAREVKDNPLSAYASVIAYQQGREVHDPTERDFLDTMATLLAKQAEAIRAFGADKLGLLDNYFPQLWKDPVRAEKLYAELRGKRPLAGASGFRKERVYADYEAGIRSGMEPAFANPADAIMARYQMGERYLSALRIRDGLERLGQLKDIGKDDRVPDGYARVNDNLFAGKVAPEIVARDLNNHLAPGLGQFKAWRNIRWFQNLMLTARLGLSAFHAGFTTVDTMVTHLDVAIRSLLRGDLGGSLKHFRDAVLSPAASPWSGHTLLKQFYGQAEADPHTAAILDALSEGGARGRMDPTDWNNDLEKFRRAWRTGDRKAAAASSIGALTEMTSRWITHHLVPYQKMAARVLLAKFELDRYADALGKEKGDYAGIAQAMNPDVLKQVMGKVVQQVDDRLGQLAYDNLFWNRTVKDIAQATIQAVGWNVGTGNTIFGGLKDVRRLFTPEKLLGPLDRAGKINDVAMSRVTGRLGYLIALNLGVGALGAITQQALTGQGPTELKDYFFPKTGRTNADGTDERISFPGYMKDEYSLATHPVETLEHKLHPSLATVAELLNNQDFYGVQIRDPNDPWTTQAGELASYIAGTFEPYAFQGAAKNVEAGQTGIMTALPFVGITPASAAVSRSPFEAYMAQRSSQDAPAGGRTIEQAQTSQAMHEAENAIRQGQHPDLSAFSGEQRRDIIRNARLPVPAIQFKRLGIVDKLNAYDQATDAERDQFKLKALIMQSHWQQSVANLPEADRQTVRDRIAALRSQ